MVLVCIPLNRLNLHSSILSRAKDNLIVCTAYWLVIVGHIALQVVGRLARVKVCIVRISFTLRKFLLLFENELVGKLLVNSCTHHGGTADARVILPVICAVLNVVARSLLER